MQFVHIWPVFLIKGLFSFVNENEKAKNLF